MNTPMIASNTYDVVVIGSGLSGLMCASALQQRGYEVIILDKSRGVGGRVASRRVDNIPLDHGLPYLEVQGSHTENLVKQLQQDNILQLWQGDIYELDADGNLKKTPVIKRYVANSGINAITKCLAKDLNIRKQHRATKIKLDKNQSWEIIYHSGDKIGSIYSKKLVIAIPAPQALELVKSIKDTLPSEFITQLQSVTFYPCIAVMAEYDSKYLEQLPSWQGVRFKNNSDLTWIALDSSKRKHPTKPIFVLHSTAQFAENHLESSDLISVGKTLLKTASSQLLPWLNSPQNFQVHRWRYAIPNQNLSLAYLSINSPLPLVCCGDWCGGNNVEAALNSGLLAGNNILVS